MSLQLGLGDRQRAAPPRASSCSDRGAAPGTHAAGSWDPGPGSRHGAAQRSSPEAPAGRPRRGARWRSRMRLLGVPGGVRRQDDARVADQGMVRGAGSTAGTSSPAPASWRRSRASRSAGSSHEAAPGDVDQVRARASCARAPARPISPPWPAPGARAATRSRTPQEVAERTPVDPQGRRLGGADTGSVPSTRSSSGARLRGQTTADPAEADDAERPAHAAGGAAAQRRRSPTRRPEAPLRAEPARARTRARRQSAWSATSSVP